MESLIIIAIQYAISFSIFGWIVRGWYEEDKRKGNKPFIWVFRYLRRK